MRLLALCVLSAVGAAACTESHAVVADPTSAELAEVALEVEARVWDFHAADTARDAQAVIDLLWPEYTMLADGARASYDDVVRGSPEFMGSLEYFHTVWSDLTVTPLGRDVAVSSFLFTDSIGTLDGELIRSRGPTTFVWQRRGDEWRILFADADHYPLETP